MYLFQPIKLQQPNLVITTELMVVVELMLNGIIPHAQRVWGKVIDRGVDMLVDEKNLNHTLEIDSPFQSFAVGFLVEFID